MEYIDLYLIHWPGVSNITVEKKENQTLRQESWNGLVSLQKEGRLKAIGVSNYTYKHLNDLLLNSSTPPTVNQVNLVLLYWQIIKLRQSVLVYTYQIISQMVNETNITIYIYSTPWKPHLFILT